MATILVVDDEPSIADLLRDVLEEEGYAVLAAYDSRAALALTRREPPDLVLSDVMMPRMDGLELARLLQEERTTRDVVVILMSAAHPPDFAAAGAVAFLAKPFDIDAIGRLVVRHLAARRAH